MIGLFHDLRYAVRRLRQTPVFTAVVIITLALGLGVNTAVFTVADRAILRALPFAESDRLVKVWQSSKMNRIRLSLSYTQIKEIEEMKGQVSAAAGYHTRRFNVSGNGEPIELEGMVTSASMFQVLGITPRLGRAFTAAEERDQVMLLSYRLWVTRWGADPGVIGQQLTIENKSYTIIGVLPPQATFPSESEQIWVPVGFTFATDPALETNRERSNFTAVVRLAPGATIPGFQAALDAAAAAVKPAAKGSDRFANGYVADQLSKDVTGSTKPALLVLLGAALLVLVTASANAAALLIARATGRQREIALRQVLGAGPGRVVRQLLVEHLLLAIAAGMLGGVLAQWGLGLLTGTWPEALPRVTGLDAPLRVMLFTFALSLLTGVAFGLVPALKAVNPDLEQSLRSGGTRAGGTRQRRRLLNGLVAAQLAVSLVLLVGAGLLLKSFIRLGGVDPGFDPAHLLAARVRLTPSRYLSRTSQDAFFEELKGRLAAIPGVEQVSMSNNLPLSGSIDYNIIDPKEIRPDDRESMLLVGLFMVGDDYPATLRMPLLAGRGFTPEDNLSSERTVVVNQALARRLWGDVPVVGKQLPMGKDHLTIVGVAADLRFGGLDEDPAPAMYLPLRQDQGDRTEMWLLMRSSGKVSTLATAVRQAVHSLDGEQPIGELVSMMDVVSRSTASRRFNMVLVTVFATLALGLAVIGIAGVTAYSLSQRTRELGIRMALGADRKSLLSLGLSEVLRVVAIGAGIGVLAAFGAARALRAMLFGVGPSDPLTYVLVTLLLAAVAITACYLPIQRAAKADPMITLRSE